MSKAIMWLTVIWIPLLMAYMNINETKAKKNIILGVTLPQQAREDADVLKELDRFKKNEWLSVACLLVMAAVMYIFSDRYAYMTPWMLWIVFCIALPYVPYVLSNSRLKNLKAEKGWVQQKRVVRVDTSVLPKENWLSPWLFVPPVLVCLLPALFDRSMMVMYVISAVMCALFWFGYRYLYRNKAEMIDDNAELTAVLTHVRRYNWGKMWLITSWFMAAVCLVAWISSFNAVISIIVSIVITVLLCWFAFRLEMRMRGIQEKLTKQSGSDWYVDEDDRWLGGLLYYNPDDSRLIINNRIGLNSTVNIAKPAGKVLIALSLLLILGLPLFGQFLDGGFSKEIKLAVEDEKIVCTSGMGNYQISLDEVTEMEVLEELPSNLRRSFGTATETLLQGTFAADAYGSMEVNLDPRQGPYLLVKTKDKTYLFGTRDGSGVREIYESNH